MPALEVSFPLLQIEPGAFQAVRLLLEFGFPGGQRRGVLLPLLPGGRQRPVALLRLAQQGASGFGLPFALALDLIAAVVPQHAVGIQIAGQFVQLPAAFVRLVRSDW